MKKKFYTFVMIILTAVLVMSSYKIYRYYAENQKRESEFKYLTDMVQSANETNESNHTNHKNNNSHNKHSKYDELHKKNSDMVGWIKIDGTTMNYPVMYTPDRPQFYLKHNFDKQYSKFGVPYIAEECDLTESDNLIIYGHHIKGGRMFGMLENYTSRSYFEQHPVIRFDTLSENAEYQIIAVFKTVANPTIGFQYYQFIKPANEEEYLAFVYQCKKLSFYETGSTAEYKDKLITLSTCEYSNQDGRLVIVAKKIS